MQSCLKSTGRRRKTSSSNSKISSGEKERSESTTSYEDFADDSDSVFESEDQAEDDCETGRSSGNPSIPSEVPELEYVHKMFRSRVYDRTKTDLNPQNE